MVNAVLTDIEGTTSSIAFVHEVLFPYASANLPAFLREHAEQHVGIVDAVRREANEPEARLDRVIDILLAWIAEDRKATPLKALQGFIWEDGYARGAFQSHVYDDAVQGLRRWHEQGFSLFVYSSGSIKAQRLLFGHSVAGDLTPLFSGYFDTTSGPKRDVASYQAIAKSIGVGSDEILFLSDVAEELDAAKGAGMQTIHVVRGDDAGVGRHPVVRSFEEILLDEGEKQ